MKILSGIQVAFEDAPAFEVLQFEQDQYGRALVKLSDSDGYPMIIMSLAMPKDEARFLRAIEAYNAALNSEDGANA